MTDIRSSIDDIFRRETGPVLATLIRQLRDFDLAEDALQDAYVDALRAWPESGIPDRPGAWLTTAARRRAIDRLRRSATLARKQETILAELVESGCDMHAFSNYPVWYRLIEERLGLSRFLDWTFVSCLTGLRKPDSPAYVQALTTLGLPAEHCLFIDDRRGNCEAAREHGIQALHFEGVESLRRSLREAGLL